MNFPLALLQRTCRLFGSLFAVRRTSGTVVPYCYGLMLAYPANHLIRFTCDGSVWVRNLLLWRDVRASNKDSKVRCRIIETLEIDIIVPQAEQPEPLEGATAGAITSEYNTKYNTKADQTKINAEVIGVAAMLTDNTRTTESKKTSVLAKCLNAMNKTIAYPLVMSAFYLLGYGDAWFPMRTARFDFRAFQRAIFDAPVAYDEPSQDFQLVAGGKDELTDTNVVGTLDEVSSYK